MQTSKLSGEALDYWLARAEGVPEQQVRIWNNISGGPRVVQNIPTVERGVTWAASKNWSQGGPLIDKYRLELNKAENGKWYVPDIQFGNHGVVVFGDTPLQAICRAVVIYAFGDEVEDTNHVG